MFALHKISTAPRSPFSFKIIKTLSKFPGFVAESHAADLINQCIVDRQLITDVDFKVNFQAEGNTIFLSIKCDDTFQLAEAPKYPWQPAVVIRRHIDSVGAQFRDS